MMESRSGEIWLATITSGLVHFRPGGVSAVINATNGLHNNAIRCLTEDQEGNIWAGGTLNGLSRLTARQFFTLGRADGLPDNTINATIKLASGDQ
jgi:ligand-binding sensor domain-containing protein